MKSAVLGESLADATIKERLKGDGLRVNIHAIEYKRKVQYHDESKRESADGCDPAT